MGLVQERRGSFGIFSYVEVCYDCSRVFDFVVDIIQVPDASANRRWR